LTDCQTAIDRITSTMRWWLCPCLLIGFAAVPLWTAEPIARPDTPPQPLTQSAPKYPQGLKEQRIVGSVNLRGVVDESGDVKDLVVDYASVEEFGHAAVAAVSRWKYIPATKAGRPSAVKVGIPVRFRLTPSDLAELDARRAKPILPPGPAVHPIEEVDTWPELKKEIRPSTPEKLKQQRQFGQAVMVFIVDELGVPRDIHPLITSHAECVQAAAAAIEKWRFTPGLKEGRVVRTELEVTLVFFPESNHASGLRVRPGL
jgi:TonB family protein